MTKTTSDLRVEERADGLAVVYDLETAQTAKREARAARKLTRRQKAAQRVTAVQQGKTKWRAKAKWLRKTHFDDDHNFGD